MCKTKFVENSKHFFFSRSKNKQPLPYIGDLLPNFQRFIEIQLSCDFTFTQILKNQKYFRYQKPKNPKLPQLATKVYLKTPINQFYAIARLGIVIGFPGIN
jgi:hypothetical protein